MTFRCDCCSIATKPNQPMHKVVSKIRDKVYSDQGNPDQPGFGVEIVKELCLCGECFSHASASGFCA